MLAWTNIYSGAPKTNSKTNLATGSSFIVDAGTNVINGITTVVAGNGGSPATGTLSASPAVNWSGTTAGTLSGMAVVSIQP